MRRGNGFRQRGSPVAELPGRLRRGLSAVLERYGPTVRERAREYMLLMRWHRPIGAQLLLWPPMWALWIAGEGYPEPLIVVVFLLGVWVMRSAGCVINDYADRNLDLHVKRTRDRPLTTGRVNAREALTLFFVLCLVAFALVLLLNRLAIMMSVVAVALAALYPFTKRYTHLPQVFLGMAFGWAVPMAFAAQAGTVPPVGWLVFLTTVLWAGIYDTMYAMVDRDDDVRIGIKSTAVLFGDLDRHIVGILQVTMMLALYLIGQRAGLDGWYNAGLLGGAALFVYQQYLIHERDRSGCFRAFMNNNWFGAVIFLGVALDYYLA